MNRASSRRPASAVQSLHPLIIALAALLCFGSLAACSDGDGGAGEDTEDTAAPDTSEPDVCIGNACQDTAGPDTSSGPDPQGDEDEDGLTNLLEDSNGNGQHDPDLGETDWQNPDTDLDGLPDGVEDADQNGFVDIGETSPLDDDTDDDTLLDGVEDTNQNGVYEPDLLETDPRRADTDDDGLDDVLEQQGDYDGAGGTTDPSNPDTDGDGLPDGVEDANQNGLLDPGETNPLDPDTDDDNISDGCEDRDANGQLDDGETDPLVVDTDGDGLDDGGAGGECNSPPVGSCPNYNNAGHCRTDPSAVDTDLDGLSDAVEVNSNYGGGIGTNPRKADTDGDGVADGAEDRNGDGAYNPELGELNPIEVSTDGNINDGQRPEAQACLDLTMPDFVVSAAGDFKFAHADAMLPVELNFNAGPGSVQAGHAFDHESQPISGFVVSKPAAIGATDALSQSEIDAGLIGYESFFGQTFTTWDGFEARLTTYRVEFSNTRDVIAVRNELVADLMGTTLAGIGNLPTGSLGGDKDMEITVLTVFRGPQQVVLVGAVHPAAPTDAISSLAQDLTNGTALAKGSDAFALSDTGAVDKACDVFRVTKLPIVDFLFLIDDTFSMDDEQDVLVSATNEIFAAIRTAFISARWAVASTEVGSQGGTRGDLSQCGLLNSPKGPGGIIWSPFTPQSEADFQCRVRDPIGVQNCDPTNSQQPGAYEYGLLCSKWAIDHIQGRRGAIDPTNLQRPRSELILVIVTDEVSWLTQSTGQDINSSAVPEIYEFLGVSSWSQVNKNNVGAAFREFYNNTASQPPFGSTTPFFIYNKFDQGNYGDRDGYWEVMDADPSAFPNGATMDITACNQNPTCTEIPEFVQKLIRTANGLASEFIPSHVPITLGMNVVVQRGFSTENVPLAHSTENGWSYDPVAGSMLFYGPNRPVLLDSFAISYGYWVEPGPDDGE